MGLPLTGKVKRYFIWTVTRLIKRYRWAARYFVFGFSSVAIKRSVECPSNSETSVKADWASVNELAAANSFIFIVCPVVA